MIYLICLISLIALKITARTLSVSQLSNQSQRFFNIESLCKKEHVICDAKNVCLVFDCDYNFKTIYLNFYTPNQLNQLHNTSNYAKCQPKRHFCVNQNKCNPECQQKSHLESDDKLQVQVNANSSMFTFNSSLNQSSNATITPENNEQFEQDQLNFNQSENTPDEDMQYSNVLSARFAPTYDSIWISSKYLIQPQGVVQCTQLFHKNIATNFGSDPECRVTRNEISVKLGKSATIAPKDKIVFNSNETIKLIEELPNSEDSDEEGEGDEQTFTIIDLIDYHIVLLEAPLYVKEPYFTISGFHQICQTEDKSQSLQIQFDNIIGTSGQPLELLWNVTVSQTTNQTQINSNIKLLNDLLPNEVYYHSFFEISHQLFLPNLKYDLTVIGKNRFGLLSTQMKYKIINSLDFKNFFININGLPAIDVSVDNMFEIQILFCAQQNSNKYLIDKFEIEVKLELNDMVVSKQTNEMFYIPRNTLFGGQTYRLTACASYADTEEVDIYSHEFITILEPLIPLINTEYLITGKSEGFLLDGSASFDPSNVADQLIFQWICTDIQKNSSQCWTNDNITQQLDMNGSTLLIPPQLSQNLNSKLYRFTLNVAKGDRQSSSHVTVEVMEERVPNIHFWTQDYKQKLKANPNRAQYFSNYLTSNGKMQNNFSFLSLNTPFNLDLNYLKIEEKSSLDSVRSLFIKIPEPLSADNWFGLQSNQLYKYSFTSSYLDGEDIAMSSITFQTNDAPTIGYLEVEPINGTGILQKYRITAHSWTDADYPLKYHFYYKYPTEISNTILAIRTGLSTSIEAYLPISLSEAHPIEIIVGVNVCDKYDLCSAKEIILNIESQNNSIDFKNSFELNHILNKNCEPIKSLAIIRSLMQTFSGDNQIEQILIPKLQEQFSHILISMNDSQHYYGIIESFSETLSTSFSTKFNENSFLNSVKNLKEVLINNLEKDYNNANNVLFLEEFIVQSNRVEFKQLLINIKTYLSYECKKLLNPTTVYESNSNLIYYRIDYHSLQKTYEIQANGNHEFIRIGGKIRPDVGNYMTLDNKVVNNFKNWMCGQSVLGIDGQVIDSGNCLGVCISSAELNFDLEMMASFSDSLTGIPHKIWSPLLFIELYSPIDGHKVMDNNNNNNNNLENSLSFVLPLDLTLNGTDIQNKGVKCAYFDQTSNIWSEDICETIFSSDKLLVCDCSRFGFFGALEFGVNHTKISAPEVSTTTIQPEITQPIDSNQNESAVTQKFVPLENQTEGNTAQPISGSTNSPEKTTLPTQVLNNTSGPTKSSEDTTNLTEDNNSNSGSTSIDQNSVPNPTTVPSEESAEQTDIQTVSDTSTSPSNSNINNNSEENKSEISTDLTTTSSVQEINVTRTPREVTSPANDLSSPTRGTTSLSQENTISVSNDTNSPQEATSPSVEGVTAITEGSPDSSEKVTNPTGEVSNSPEVTTIASEAVSNTIESTTNNDDITVTLIVTSSIPNLIANNSDPSNSPQKTTVPSEVSGSENTNSVELTTSAEVVTTFNESNVTKGGVTKSDEKTSGVTEVSVVLPSTEPESTATTGNTQTSVIVSTESGVTQTKTNPTNEESPQNDTQIETTSADVSTATQTSIDGNPTTAQTYSETVVTNSNTSPSVGVTQKPEPSKQAEEVTETTNKTEVTTVGSDDKPTESQQSNKEFILNTKYKIETDFNEFIDNNKMSETKKHLMTQFRQIFSIPEEYKIEVILRSGSVLIDIIITSDQQLDENSLLNQTFVLTDLKGRQFIARKLMANEDKDMTTTQTAVQSSIKVNDPISSTVPSEVGSTKPTKDESTATQQQITDLASTVSPTNSNTTTESTKFWMSMTITIDGEYDEVVGDDKHKFLDDVKKQLARYLRIPFSCIENMDSKPGSIIVIFEMIPSLDPNFPINKEELISAKYEFEQKIRANQVYIIDSKGEKHLVLSSIDNNNGNGQRTENTGSSNQMSYIIMGVAIGAVLIMITLIIITACAVRSYMYRKFLRQIRPRTQDQMIRDTPSRDGIHSVNTMRLLTGLSREADSSSGLYSYDSGVWVGPEPEITVKGVPEPPLYLPPKENEISLIPKPPPEVIKRLKSDWSALAGNDHLNGQDYPNIDF